MSTTAATGQQHNATIAVVAPAPEKYAVERNTQRAALSDCRRG